MSGLKPAAQACNRSLWRAQQRGSSKRVDFSVRDTFPNVVDGKRISSIHGTGHRRDDRTKLYTVHIAKFCDCMLPQKEVPDVDQHATLRQFQASPPQFATSTNPNCPTCPFQQTAKITPVLHELAFQISAQQSAGMQFCNSACRPLCRNHSALL